MNIGVHGGHVKRGRLGDFVWVQLTNISYGYVTTSVDMKV